MSNNTQPEIRFPGFMEDWEERKLNELAEFNPKSDLPERFEYVDLESVVGTELVRHRTENRYSAPSRAQRLAKKNDVFYQTVRPYQKNNYLFDLPYDNYVFSTGYAQMRPIGNGYFLLTLIQEEKFVNRVLERSTGTSYPAINSNDLAKLPVKVPADIQEQQKVGTFFKQIDNTITLHQRKLDLLKETKKGFLQKMFPKNGAKVPEVRFPGFTEDWEERKFGEIVQVSRGLTYKPSDVQIEGIRVLRSSNINEDVFVLRDDDVFVKPDAVNIAPIKNGDILITSANGSSRLVGKHAIVNGLQDKTVHGGFMLRVKSKNTWFTNSLMSSRWYNYFINIYVSGGNGAIGNLRKYDLESQTIIVPDDEEQQKIGAFFKQLDDTIALHQRKLDLLKETKKSFLQKMFV
ncbi:TPA: restriction endonuclease subunit S [Enterococcus faecium]|uniref:restriction endonuclease subunit S n=1 Tax=Enterococcus faecium TaxID=1352 RepID=UPI000416D183|nr:restriction endonuclease subunit S [Enterococcus faecium]HAQ3731383.1 restriction endonuclease subunit S [Enterococcus faecium]HAQ3734275.1 restriction endonuclease subunit S [Enterococcus faecium]HAQ3740039.1 restriction endonuclease subunit S [Enterococcus faecium]HAQ3742819.1 restriction endonuclease subunit S [Enterococcus faecium]HAQ3754477.1 restriction endonuclease subunit S [Enterococcus faecium]